MESNVTLAKLFDKIIPLLVTKKVDCSVHTADDEADVNCAGCTTGEPNPAFAPLLAVVQEPYWERYADWREGKPPTGYVSRAAFWSQADNGALEGAWIKAVRHADQRGEVHYSVGWLSDTLLGILCEQGDTRIAATQTILEWLKEKP